VNESALREKPQTLVNHALFCLKVERPDAALASLHACFAQGATFNADPVPSDTDDFLDDLDDDMRAVLTEHTEAIRTEPTSDEPDTYTESATLMHRGVDYITTFHLSRTGAGDGYSMPTASPWRIHTLTIEPPNHGFR
jgi:hypothetical protein